jgi:hypothetical protein
VLLSPLDPESLLLLLVHRIKCLAFDVVRRGAQRSRHLGQFRLFCSQYCMGVRRFECLTRGIPGPPSELLQELFAERVNFLLNKVIIFPRECSYFSGSNETVHRINILFVLQLDPEVITSHLHFAFALVFQDLLVGFTMLHRNGIQSHAIRCSIVRAHVREIANDIAVGTAGETQVSACWFRTGYYGRKS